MAGKSKQSQEPAGSTAARAETNTRSVHQITRQMWLEDALHGWIIPVAGVSIIGIVTLLYYFDFLGEWSVGLLFGSAVGVGPILIALVQAMSLAKSPRQAMLAWAAGGTLALVTLASVIAACFPGQVLFSGVLSPEHRDAPLSSSSSAVEVSVVGHIDGMGKAPYDLSVVTPAGQKHLQGEVIKEEHRARMGRRSVGGVVQESAERRFVAFLPGDATSIHLETLDNAISELRIDVRNIWLPFLPLMVLGTAAALTLVFLDGRMSTKTRQTWLSMAGTFTLLFAYVFFDEATHGQMVRNAFGAMLMSGLGAAVGGLVLAAISRSFFGGPASRKAAGAAG